ncbi:MAG: type II toxin-antitoxin system VapC family toxin [Candidatus Kryptoniota bacterium]
MKFYLDLCCYNRPFDDQTYIKIKLETDAKLFIREAIWLGKYEIAWSYILDYENMENPFEEQREAIKFWKSIAVKDVNENNRVLVLAEEIKEFGVKTKDALHIACAIHAGCDYFLTTDDAIIRKTATFERIKAVNPIEFINAEVRHGK